MNKDVVIILLILSIVLIFGMTLGAKVMSYEMERRIYVLNQDFNRTVSNIKAWDTIVCNQMVNQSIVKGFNDGIEYFTTGFINEMEYLCANRIDLGLPNNRTWRCL